MKLDIRRFDKYQTNLILVNDEIVSYSTHVATINRETNQIEIFGSFSVTTSKHINYVAEQLNLTLTLHNPKMDEIHVSTPSKKKKK